MQKWITTRNRYIYIQLSTDRSVSFYQNSTVWLDILASCSWDRNPVDSNANPKLYPSSTRILVSSDYKFSFAYVQFLILKFSFAYVQFRCQKQFYFKLFSFALLCNLNTKTVLFQAIMFIISTQFSSILTYR